MSDTIFYIKNGNNQLLYDDWGYVPGYEGLYIISMRGVLIAVSKVTFKSRRYKKPKRSLILTKPILIKTQITKAGYEIAHLSKNNIRKAFTVHRLIGIIFLPNPNNLPQINHVDLIKTHNEFYNLEWMTQSQNISHAYANGGNENARQKARERMRLLGIKYAGRNTQFLLKKNIEISKPVLQLDMNGNFIKEYPSIKAAQRDTKAYNVGKVLKGEYNQSNGFKWALK